jgi:hypothetical protein
MQMHSRFSRARHSVCMSFIVGFTFSYLVLIYQLDGRLSRIFFINCSNGPCHTRRQVQLSYG